MASQVGAMQGLWVCMFATAPAAGQRLCFTYDVLVVCLSQRCQHQSNLLALLDQCLLVGDHAATAAVCSVLLGMQVRMRIIHSPLCPAFQAHVIHVPNNLQDLRGLAEPKFKDNFAFQGWAGMQFRVSSILNAATEVVLSQGLPPNQVGCFSIFSLFC